MVQLMQLVSVCVLAHMVSACSYIEVESTDGVIVSGRTMDWGGPMDLFLTSYAKGTQSQSFSPKDLSGEYLSPDMTPGGMKWTSKYDVVGMEESHGIFADGLNKAGLSCALLYLPRYTKYMPEEKVDIKKAILAPELCRWALQTKASIKELRIALKDEVHIWAPEEVLPGMDGGVHYAFADKTGESIVVEFIEGETKVYDNVGGVMTNAPTFEWHEISMNDYGNLVRETTEGSSSQGSGMVGLPGSFTSTDRFIRLRKLREYADKPETALEAVTQANTFLGETTILLGTVRDVSGKDEAFDVTLYTSVWDQTNLVYYYRTRTNPNLNKISLENVQFKGTQRFPLFKPLDNIYDATKAWES